jgi:hypothetical protein
MAYGDDGMPIDQNDHDLLIALNTKMEMLIKFYGDSNNQIAMLGARITSLENRDGRDSEKFAAIRKDVEDNLKKADQVPAIMAEIQAMKEEISDLKAKSNTWSVLNSVGVAVVAVVAWIFGR